MEGECFRVLDLATDQPVTSDTLRIMGQTPKIDTDMVMMELEELTKIIDSQTPNI